MADKSIHELPVASLLTDAGLLVVYQDQKTQSIRGELIKQYAAQGVSQYVEEAKTAARTAGDAAGEAQAAAEEAKGVALYPPQVNPETGMWQTWDAAQQQYVDTDQKAEGPDGPAGSSIQSIERTSGTGAPGTTDTYTVTLTNGSTTTFQVYNGADGAGTGDFKADGSVPMTGSLQMAGHTISGLPAPVADSDPVRKQDVPTLAADRQLSNLDTPQAALVNLGAGVRPNLVENWMLKNAINQKGQLSYSGDFAFSIDRWRLGPKTSMTVSESGEVTAIGDGSGESYIFQHLESLEKGTYTYSFLFTDNTGVVTLTTKQTDEGTAVPVNSGDPAGLLSLTFEAQGLGPGVGYIRIGMTGSVKPVAAKLERGSNQTLAHLKSDGAWEILPQPNNKPDEVLRECQRYLMVFGENTGYTPLGIGQARSDSDIVATIPIPCKMRTKPAATLSENIVARNGDSYFNLTTPTVEGLSDSAVMVSFVGSGLTVGAVYEVFLEIGKFFTLSSEL